MQNFQNIHNSIDQISFAPRRLIFFPSDAPQAQPVAEALKTQEGGILDNANLQDESNKTEQQIIQVVAQVEREIKAAGGDLSEAERAEFIKQAKAADTLTKDDNPATLNRTLATLRETLSRIRPNRERKEAEAKLKEAIDALAKDTAELKKRSDTYSADMSDPVKELREIKLKVFALNGRAKAAEGIYNVVSTQAGSVVPQEQVNQFNQVKNDLKGIDEKANKDLHGLVKSAAEALSKSEGSPDKAPDVYKKMAALVEGFSNLNLSTLPNNLIKQAEDIRDRAKAITDKSPAAPPSSEPEASAAIDPNLHAGSPEYARLFGDAGKEQGSAGKKLIEELRNAQPPVVIDENNPGKALEDYAKQNPAKAKELAEKVLAGVDKDSHASKVELTVTTLDAGSSLKSYGDDGKETGSRFPKGAKLELALGTDNKAQVKMDAEGHVMIKVKTPGVAADGAAAQEVWVNAFYVDAGIKGASPEPTPEEAKPEAEEEPKPAASNSGEKQPPAAPAAAPGGEPTRSVEPPVGSVESPETKAAKEAFEKLGLNVAEGLNVEPTAVQADGKVRVRISVGEGHRDTMELLVSSIGIEKTSLIQIDPLYEIKDGMIRRKPAESAVRPGEPSIRQG